MSCHSNTVYCPCLDVPEPNSCHYLDPVDSIDTQTCFYWKAKCGPKKNGCTCCPPQPNLPPPNGYRGLFKGRVGQFWNINSFSDPRFIRVEEAYAPKGTADTWNGDDDPDNGGRLFWVTKGLRIEYITIPGFIGDHLDTAFQRVQATVEGQAYSGFISTLAQSFNSIAHYVTQWAE